MFYLNTKAGYKSTRSQVEAIDIVLDALHDAGLTASRQEVQEAIASTPVDASLVFEGIVYLALTAEAVDWRTV